MDTQATSSLWSTRHCLKMWATQRAALWLRWVDREWQAPNAAQAITGSNVAPPCSALSATELECSYSNWARKRARMLKIIDWLNTSQSLPTNQPEKMTQKYAVTGLWRKKTHTCMVGTGLSQISLVDLWAFINYLLAGKGSQPYVRQSASKRRRTKPISPLSRRNLHTEWNNAKMIIFVIEICNKFQF